jgi:hypothetical protein
MATAGQVAASFEVGAGFHAVCDGLTVMREELRRLLRGKFTSILEV